jgi:hypothetical protein
MNLYIQPFISARCAASTRLRAPAVATPVLRWIAACSVLTHSISEVGHHGDDFPTDDLER